MRAEPPRSEEAEPALRALERDLLLASSGELPWYRRLLLGRRLRRDAEARRLAETLALTTLLGTAPRASDQERTTTPLRAATLAIAIVAAGLLIGLTIGLFRGFGTKDDASSGVTTIVVGAEVASGARQQAPGGAQSTAGSPSDSSTNLQSRPLANSLASATQRLLLLAIAGNLSLQESGERPSRAARPAWSGIPLEAEDAIRLRTAMWSSRTPRSNQPNEGDEPGKRKTR